MGAGNELLATVLSSSVLTALIAAFSTWQLRGRLAGRTPSEHGVLDRTEEDRGPSRAKLEAELEVERKKVAALEIQLAVATKQLSQFEKCRLIRTVQQPVLLLGPRNVGKTSLVRLWHSPWDQRALSSTDDHLHCIVPVIEWDEGVSVEPPAVGELLPYTRTSLKLKVHDFPGELSQQKAISRTVREETEKLRAKHPDSPGVVIICMFNAEEALTGVTKATSKYYNGDLFRELKTLYATGSVNIERVILVFNKIDLLRRHFPHGTTNGEILETCLRKFDTVCAPIFGLVHSDRVCEVMTVLGSADEHRKSEGAEVVKGEAAQPLYELLAGAEASDRVTPERASRLAGAVMGY